MPDAPLRPCLAAGCGEYAVREGRCGEHARAARGKTAERGYDAVWRRFRIWFLRRHPICEDCGRAAEQVHHVKKVAQFPALRLAESNCMALCEKCHTVRTARGE